MSREQLSEHDSLQSGDGQQEAVQGDFHGLPPHLYTQAMSIRPGDVAGLTTLLRLYSDFSQPIIAAVAPRVGNSTVQAALQATSRNAVGRGVHLDKSIVDDVPHAAAQAPAVGASPGIAADAWKDGGKYELESDAPELLRTPTQGVANPGGKPAVGHSANISTDAWKSGGKYELESSDPALLHQPEKLHMGKAEVSGIVNDAGDKDPHAELPWVAGARSYNLAHAGLVADFNAATQQACVNAEGKLDPLRVADWQEAHGLAADGRVGPKTLEASKKGPLAPESEEGGPVVDDAARAEMGPEQAPKAEEDWKPSTVKNETKLTGTYGEYTVKHGFHYDATDGWSYEVEIKMKAGEKATAEKIGWIQVVRRSKGAGGSGWATGKDDQGMTDERAKRTDAKSGFRVDRVSAPDKKTPFYGMSKGSDGKLNAASNTVIGKHGGADPYLYDGPGLYDKDEVEFVSTATALDTGTQYDAIHWGCKYDKAGKIATETTPACVKAGDDLIAGRDRAVNKWNNDVAKGDIDKVPTTADPVATANTLKGMLAGSTTDEAGVAKTLKETTDPDLRKRIQAAYHMETGKTLADDLKAHLGKDALTGLDAWL